MTIIPIRSIEPAIRHIKQCESGNRKCHGKHMTEDKKRWTSICPCCNVCSGWQHSKLYEDSTRSHGTQKLQYDWLKHLGSFPSGPLLALFSLLNASFLSQQASRLSCASVPSPIFLWDQRRTYAHVLMWR